MAKYEFRKINLNECEKREIDIDVLNRLGINGWELVAITPHNFAYLKREIGEVIEALPVPAPVPQERRRRARAAA